MNMNIPIMHFAFAANLLASQPASQFSSSINTWRGLSKKLKEHQNGVLHKKCFSRWLLLKKGISTYLAMDRQAMQVFLTQRTFYRSDLERLIDIVILLAERI